MQLIIRATLSGTTCGWVKDQAGRLIIGRRRDALPFVDPRQAFSAVSLMAGACRGTGIVFSVEPDEVGFSNENEEVSRPPFVTKAKTPLRDRHMTSVMPM